MSPKELNELINTYTEVLRMHQFNIEVLNTLEQTLFHIQDFCRKQRIPFHDEKISISISKIEGLLEEIDCKYPHITFISSRRKVTDPDGNDGTVGEVPVPFSPIFLDVRFVMMPLDLPGTIILTLSVVVLFLLVLGLPLVALYFRCDCRRFRIFLFSFVALFFSFTNNVCSSKKIHDANLNNLGSRDNYWGLNPLVTNVLTFIPNKFL